MVHVFVWVIVLSHAGGDDGCGTDSAAGRSTPRGVPVVVVRLGDVHDDPWRQRPRRMDPVSEDDRRWRGRATSFVGFGCPLWHLQRAL